MLYIFCVVIASELKYTLKWVFHRYIYYRSVSSHYINCICIFHFLCAHPKSFLQFQGQVLHLRHLRALASQAISKVPKWRHNSANGDSPPTSWQAAQETPVKFRSWE